MMFTPSGAHFLISENMSSVLTSPASAPRFIQKSIFSFDPAVTKLLQP